MEFNELTADQFNELFKYYFNLKSQRDKEKDDVKYVLDDDYVKRLIEEEKKKEKEMSKTANKIQQERNEIELFYNLSLKQIANNLLYHMSGVLTEFVDLLTKPIGNISDISGDISGGSNDKEKTKNDRLKALGQIDVPWWDNGRYYLTNIVKILTKEDRLIYVGIFLVVISFFVYFILVSS
jgi:hypothetical protein